MKHWYEIKAQADGEIAEVWIYGIIGEDFWTGEGVKAKDLCVELAKLDVAQLDVHINSPGGDYFGGVAIYGALRRHKAQVNVFVDGYAASAAWLIALAGDNRVMAENGFMMFHRAWACKCGNSLDMLSLAEKLEKLDDQQISTAMGCCTKPEATVREHMDSGETWLSAEEAVEWGFATAIEEPVRAAALTHVAQSFGKLGFKNAPAAHEAAPDPVNDRDAGGAPAIASDPEGGAPSVRPETFVPGFGFRRF